MSKLNKEELLDELINAYGHHPSSIKNEQAYQQIKEILQNPEITEKEADKLFDGIDQIHYYMDRKRKFKQTLKEIGIRVA